MRKKSLCLIGTLGLILVLAICFLGCNPSPGPAGPQGERGPQGIQGIQGEPGPKLIVAMGYVEDLSLGEEGTPQLLDGFNVKEVSWDVINRCYTITLTSPNSGKYDYVILVTPVGNEPVYTTTTWERKGEFHVIIHRKAGDGNIPGSFQFVVFRYP